MAGAPLERLLPGDRVPDVRLHGSDGGRTLHAEFAGAPIWLLKPSSATVAASLPEVPKGITALCVGAQAFPGTAAGWLSLGADARWLELFEDDVLWLADANLRLQQEQRLPSSHAPLPARMVELCSCLRLADLRLGCRVRTTPGGVSGWDGLET